MDTAHSNPEFIVHRSPFSVSEGSSFNVSSTVSASRDQISSELSGEVVIMDLNSGVYHGLDETGARIWQLLQTPRKVADIRDVLLSEYDVEADRCERDLMELLESMSAKGLLQVHADIAA